MELFSLFSAIISGIFVWTLIAYSIGIISKDHSWIDMFYGLGYILVTVISLVMVEKITLVSLTLSILICIWGIRLSSYIFYRKLTWQKGEDKRYQNLKTSNKILNFFKIYLVQASVIFIVVLPVVFIIYSQIEIESVISQMIFSAANTVIFFGIGFEAIADFQLTRFKLNNESGVMDSGLWSLSRHPNYFGEFVTWWGIYLMTFLVFPINIPIIISPLVISYLLLRVSGVTMLEETKSKDDKYQEYKESVPAFFPKFAITNHSENSK
jgi:steroid 5-alpha reductase family enzyme